MSIWDQPQPPESTTDTKPMTGSQRVDAPAVPTVGGRERVMGTQAGPLLSDAGRGIVNGVPYGESEQARVEAANAMYPFAPTWRSRLGAATRKALGR